MMKRKKTPSPVLGQTRKNNARMEMKQMGRPMLQMKMRVMKKMKMKKMTRMTSMRLMKKMCPKMRRMTMRKTNRTPFFGLNFFFSK